MFFTLCWWLYSQDFHLMFVIPFLSSFFFSLVRTVSHFSSAYSENVNFNHNSFCVRCCVLKQPNKMKVTVEATSITITRTHNRGTDRFYCISQPIWEIFISSNSHPIRFTSIRRNYGTPKWHQTHTYRMCIIWYILFMWTTTFNIT